MKITGIFMILLDIASSTGNNSLNTVYSTNGMSSVIAGQDNALAYFP